MQRTQAKSVEHIKSLVDAGHRVHWANDGYVVVKDKIGQYLIKCIHNNHCIGLTWADGVTLNGKIADFYTVSTDQSDSYAEFHKLTAEANAMYTRARRTGCGMMYAAAETTRLHAESLLPMGCWVRYDDDGTPTIYRVESA